MKTTKPKKVKPPGIKAVLPTDVSDQTPQWKALTLDVDYYQTFLDDEDISEDRKLELIETLWQIIVAFVDLGFGVHPVQQAVEDRSSKDMDVIHQFAQQTGRDMQGENKKVCEEAL